MLRCERKDPSARIARSLAGAKVGLAHGDDNPAGREGPAGRSRRALRILSQVEPIGKDRHQPAAQTAAHWPVGIDGAANKSQVSAAYFGTFPPAPLHPRRLVRRIGPVRCGRLRAGLATRPVSFPLLARGAHGQHCSTLTPPYWPCGLRRIVRRHESIRLPANRLPGPNRTPRQGACLFPARRWRRRRHNHYFLRA